MPRRPFIPDYIEKFVDIATREGHYQLAKIVLRHAKTRRFNQIWSANNTIKTKKARKVLKNKARK